jgi:hypothetical protein
MEYCKFQSTSSIDGRVLDSLFRQLIAISAAVFRDSYAKVPRVDGSTKACNFDGASAKPFSSCKLNPEKRRKKRFKQ